MPVTTERSSSAAGGSGSDSIGARYDHGHCLMCGERNPWSLALRFEAMPDGGVRTRFTGRPELQGFEGMLHGGIIAALLDAAMTHCLFHRGVRAVTGDLRVRYVHPVPWDATVDLGARVLVSDRRLHRLRADLELDGRTMAWAEAKFMRSEAPAGG